MMNSQQMGNIRRAAEAAALWKARREEINRLYHERQLSQAQVAAHYGVTLAAIQKVMARLGIKSRGRGNTGERNGRYRHGKATTIYRTMIEKTACVQCGVVDDLCIHHKDGDHYNNVPDNLQVLCNPCHNRMHKGEWWRSRKGGE